MIRIGRQESMQFGSTCALQPHDDPGGVQGLFEDLRVMLEKIFSPETDIQELIKRSRVINLPTGCKSASSFTDFSNRSRARLKSLFQGSPVRWLSLPP